MQQQYIFIWNEVCFQKPWAAGRVIGDGINSATAPKSTRRAASGFRSWFLYSKDGCASIPWADPHCQLHLQQWVSRERRHPLRHSTPAQAVLKRTQNFPCRGEVLNRGNLPPVHIWQGPETFMGVLGLRSRRVGLCSGVRELVRLCCHPQGRGQGFCEDSQCTQQTTK